MSDLISRQAAKRHFYMHVSGLAWDKINAILDDIPSIKPERKRDEWIPCSERLPEEDGNYLIWFQYLNPFGNLSESMAMEYYAESTGWDCDNVEVIAWHLLPEPYNVQS